VKTTTTTTTTTAPAAAGLALASLAAELLAQGIAAALAPAIALALTLAGCGHELALAARRRREAMAAAAEPAVSCWAAIPMVTEEEIAEYSSLTALMTGCYQTKPSAPVVAAAVITRREEQAAAYRNLAGLAVRELRQMARAAGHRQLARQGRRSELLAALVPA
jgi:hypothetical protein